MIITKTFKCGRGIELRVYVQWMKASEVEAYNRAARDAVEEALGIKRENFKVADEIVSYDQLTLCSNRAGLHYAYYRRVESLSDGEAFVARLKRAGWKESKGN